MCACGRTGGTHMLAMTITGNGNGNHWPLWHPCPVSSLVNIPDRFDPNSSHVTQVPPLQRTCSTAYNQWP